MVHKLSMFQFVKIILCSCWPDSWFLAHQACGFFFCQHMLWASVSQLFLRFFFFFSFFPSSEVAQWAGTCKETGPSWDDPGRVLWDGQQHPITPQLLFCCWAFQVPSSNRGVLLIYIYIRTLSLLQYTYIYTFTLPRKHKKSLQQRRPNRVGLFWGYGLWPLPT